MKQKKETVPAYISILETIEEISNSKYQLQQWVSRMDPNNYGCYENTIMYFLEDAEAILNSWENNFIEMTDNQYHMLKKLYEMVEVYDMSNERPEYDKDIVNDPKWHKIRDYARLVYEALIEKKISD